ncbi:MAG: flagellar basal body P-ring protein FlgI [Desulfovibrionaceae bacterium]
MLKVFFLSCMFFIISHESFAISIKDIGSFSGVRENQLVGYGLVVGLGGTGDKKDSKFTMTSMANMLASMGISVDSALLKPKNIAAVMVTVNMPISAKPGTKLDATVSSIGDASSIEGGVLLMTPIKGVDGKIYALAQGSVLTGGYSVEGAGASVKKNATTVGTVPSGATIEKAISFSFNEQEKLKLHLTTSEPTTTMNTVNAINELLGKDAAKAEDLSTISIRIPEDNKGNLVPLLASIESLDIVTSSIAKIVIDERSGTVVMGEDVRLRPVAIAHGNLQIVIKEDETVSQPEAFSNGETVITPDTNITIQEDGSKLVFVNGATLKELVDGLNAIGATPRDLITIIRALKRSGALYGTIEVI